MWAVERAVRDVDLDKAVQAVFRRTGPAKLVLDRGNVRNFRLQFLIENVGCLHGQRSAQLLLSVSKRFCEADLRRRKVNDRQRRLAQGHCIFGHVPALRAAGQQEHLLHKEAADGLRDEDDRPVAHAGREQPPKHPGCRDQVLADALVLPS